MNAREHTENNFRPKYSQLYTDHIVELRQLYSVSADVEIRRFGMRMQSEKATKLNASYLLPASPIQFQTIFASFLSFLYLTTNYRYVHANVKAFERSTTRIYRVCCRKLFKISSTSLRDSTVFVTFETNAKVYTDRSYEIIKPSVY